MPGAPRQDGIDPELRSLLVRVFEAGGCAMDLLPPELAELAEKGVEAGLLRYRHSSWADSDWLPLTDAGRAAIEDRADAPKASGLRRRILRFLKGR